MDAGGLAQMSGTTSSLSPSLGGLGMPSSSPASSGLASRRAGGQNIKPLSFDASMSIHQHDNGAPTPRTSRMNMLAGLRKGPKTSTATSFPASPTAAAGSHSHHMYGGRANSGDNNYNLARGHAVGQDAGGYFNAPKTALPSFYGGGVVAGGGGSGGGGSGNQGHSGLAPGGGGAHYTVDQVLAPPEIHLDEHGQEGMDPALYAQLVATNMYLAHQQQQLQQQLLNIQAAAQQFQGLNLNSVQQQQYAVMLGQQHSQLANLQQVAAAQGGVCVYVDPATGQRTYYLNADAQNAAAAAAQFANGNQYMDPMTMMVNNQQQRQQQQQQQQHHLQQQHGHHQQHQRQQQQLQQQQLQHLLLQQQQQQQQAYLSALAPRVQVSPPAEMSQLPLPPPAGRSDTPPKRYGSPTESGSSTATATPLPPPSANAFRRGHKKNSSLAINSSLAMATAGDVVPKSAGPKTSSFPQTPGSYGPGQARAGEHPVRQPRGPPPMDELLARPTAKHEGSKNFAARTRRSAVHNLVKAGLVRRNGTSSSYGSGSVSPVSETADEAAEEAGSPLTDNESDSGRSGRSGSGSLAGDLECSLPSSRSSATGAWGAIGSERPGSRQKSRKSVDSLYSDDGSDHGANASTSTFANVFKTAAQRAAQDSNPGSESQRKAPMLVLTSGEKRKNGV